MADPNLNSNMPTILLSELSTEAEVRAAMYKLNLPPYMVSGVHLYLTRGIMTGSFLTAVMEGRFRQAMHAADSANREAIYRWDEFLANSVVSAAHGSPEKVRAWKAAREKEEIALIEQVEEDMLDSLDDPPAWEFDDDPR